MQIDRRLHIADQIRRRSPCVEDDVNDAEGRQVRGSRHRIQLRVFVGERPAGRQAQQRPENRVRQIAASDVR